MVWGQTNSKAGSPLQKHIHAHTHTCIHARTHQIAAEPEQFLVLPRLGRVAVVGLCVLLVLVVAGGGGDGMDGRGWIIFFVGGLGGIRWMRWKGRGGEGCIICICMNECKPASTVSFSAPPCYAHLRKEKKTPHTVSRTAQSHSSTLPSRFPLLCFTLILMPLPTLRAKFLERSSTCTCDGWWRCCGGDKMVMVVGGDEVLGVCSCR